MATYTKVEIDNILGNPVYGVTPTPTPGYSLEFIDSNTRNLTAAIRAFMSATKGISSISKDGETLTITFTDGTTQTETIPNGSDGAGAGWTMDTQTNLVYAILTNGTWFYRTPSSALGIHTELNPGDSSVVEFITGSTAITYSVPSGSYHAGDSCDGGVFVPAANSHYTIIYIHEYQGLAGYVLRRDN